MRTLRRLKNDETLIVQSGKPVAVWKTHARAPRVLIANSNLVPKWADWSVFRELEAQGLTMYGQMTAGSWIYIGTQGIVQGTYETFAELARQHFGGALEGRVTLTAGVGGMGGAQPLAVDDERRRSALVVDVDRARLERRRDLRYLDRVVDSREEALREVETARVARRGRLDRLRRQRGRWSSRELYDAGFRPDAVTDQTSAHDLLNGYVPAGLSLEEAAELRRARSGRVRAPRAGELRRSTSTRWCAISTRARSSSTTATTFARRPQRAGFARAFEFPGFVPAFIRPLFCRGSGPFRFAALSGDPSDIARCDEKLLELFPGRRRTRAMDHVSRASASRSKACRRASAGSVTAIARRPGSRFNELVRAGEVKAPIVIGRDHLDTGSVASPYRETEAMRDGSDAIADWPILNALLNTAAGAHWVSFHHGGGVGIGYSLHAGMVVVADGSDDARERLGCVLTTDRAWASFATPTRATRSRSKPPTKKASTGACRSSRARVHFFLWPSARSSSAPRRSSRATPTPRNAASISTSSAASTSAIVIEGRSVVRKSIGNAKIEVARHGATAEIVDLRECVDRARLRRRARAPALCRRSRARLRRAAARRARAARHALHGRADARSAARSDEQFYERRCARDCETILAHGTTTLETKTGYALHKPGESALARPDRAIIAAIPTFRSSSRRFSARTRCRRSLRARRHSSIISSIK